MIASRLMKRVLRQALESLWEKLSRGFADRGLDPIPAVPRMEVVDLTQVSSPHADAIENEFRELIRSLELPAVETCGECENCLTRWN